MLGRAAGKSEKRNVSGKALLEMGEPKLFWDWPTIYKLEGAKNENPGGRVFFKSFTSSRNISPSSFFYIYIYIFIIIIITTTRELLRNKTLSCRLTCLIGWL